jgi:hypothetical protein
MWSAVDSLCLSLGLHHLKVSVIHVDDYVAEKKKKKKTGMEKQTST